MPTKRRPLTRLQTPRKIPVAVAMSSETTRWAAPLALTRVLLVGLCVCWPSCTRTEDAVEAIRLAAEQGDASAQDDLGLMYADGRGVPRDETEAAGWFRLPADQGQAEAQFNLGRMYANGRGVPQDYVAAYMWFSLAAAQSSDAAKNRDLAATLMTAEQVAEAQRLAREWKPTVEP